MASLLHRSLPCSARLTTGLTRGLTIGLTKGLTTEAAATTALIEDWTNRMKQVSIHDTDTVSASTQQLLAMTIHPLSLALDREAAAKQLSSSPCYEALRQLPPSGSAVRAGSHFTLFPLRTPEPLLAIDGYDTDWSPPSPFVQRMWAGGDIQWMPHNPLGHAMFVTIAKDISNQAGVAVKELRSYVYLENKPEAAPAAVNAKHTLESDFQTTVLPTTASLFRFSALTFNSHLIHYDHNYASIKEGYDGCLVHGPMTCSLLLDHFRRNAPNKTIRRFTYRAISAVFVGRPLTLHGQWAVQPSDGKAYCKLWATNEKGSIAMKGTLEFE
ncbi:hypothetical protein BSLG_003572 [Batrachochytrium salamandrivorans]|nr:hypothetical protein BSLG_003572 [Batrachochytrium salamandrivorans]